MNCAGFTPSNKHAYSARSYYIYPVQLLNVPFGPISALGSNIYPENTKCISAVKIFTRFDFDQAETFWDLLCRWVTAFRFHGHVKSWKTPLLSFRRTDCVVILFAVQNLNVL